MTVCIIGAVAFIGLGVYAAVQNSVGTHYNATVSVCYGGRYNPCDIVVHTAAGDVAASANLSNVHVNETIRVIADGSPPWRHVTQLNNPWAIPDILGIFTLSVVFLFAGLFIVRIVHRNFGLKSLTPRPTPQTA